MGAQASTNVSKQKSDIVTQSYNKCPPVSAQNKTDIEGVKFNPPTEICLKYGIKPVFEINQNAGVKADCVISNLQDTLAEAISKLDAEAQGGLGFQASTNISDISAKITQTLDNSCGKLDAKNIIAIKDTEVTSCDWRFVQNATAQSSCKINNLQKLANKIETQEKAKTEGLTLGNFLLGNGPFVAIGMVIIIIVIIIFLYYYFSRRSSRPASLEEIALLTGGSQTNYFGFPNTPMGSGSGLEFGINMYSAMIFGIIILIMFMLFGKDKPKTVTEKDMSDLNKSIRDAQRIAHLLSETSSEPGTPVGIPPILSERDVSDEKLDDFYKPLLM